MKFEERNMMVEEKTSTIKNNRMSGYEFLGKYGSLKQIYTQS